MKDIWEVFHGFDERHIKILEEYVRDCDYAHFPWWKKIIKFPVKNIYDEYLPYWQQKLLEVKADYQKLKEKYEAAE